jgi:hypothetical protein
MIIEHMREGSMSQIMAKTCNTHIKDVSVSDLQAFLLFLQLLHHFLCQMTCTYAMLKAIVYGCREDIVYAPELLEIPQPLELLSVNNVPTKNEKNVSFLESPQIITTY